MNDDIISPVYFDDSTIGRKSIYLNIPGIAIAKQRPRAVRKGKYIQVYTPNKTKDYEKKVERQYKEMYGKDAKLSGPIIAKIEGVFPVPNSASKKQKELLLNGYHTKKPDCDNMAKTPLDALNGIAYDDDSQIVELHITKRYGTHAELNIILFEDGD